MHFLYHCGLTICHKQVSRKVLLNPLPHSVGTNHLVFHCCQFQCAEHVTCTLSRFTLTTDIYFGFHYNLCQKYLLQNNWASYHKITFVFMHSNCYPCQILMKLEFSQQSHNKTTILFRQEHNNST